MIDKEKIFIGFMILYFFLNTVIAVDNKVAIINVLNIKENKTGYAICDLDKNCKMLDNKTPNEVRKEILKSKEYYNTLTYGIMLSILPLMFIMKKIYNRITDFINGEKWINA